MERVPGGDVVLGLTKLEGVTAVPDLNSATSKRKLELEQKWGKPIDKLLTDMIHSDKSVNTICKELGISTATFYSWVGEYYFSLMAFVSKCFKSRFMVII